MLVPIKDAPARDDIPYSRNALNWIAFFRGKNGAAQVGAIVKVGGRLFLDPVKFTEWMRSNPIISPPGIRRPAKNPKKSEAAGEAA